MGTAEAERQRRLLGQRLCRRRGGSSCCCWRGFWRK